MEGCSLVKPLVGAYLDGELDSETAEKVADHLQECDCCRSDLRKVAGVDRLVCSRESEEIPQAQWDRVEENILTRAKSGSSARTMRTAAAAAAAAILLVFLVWFVVYMWQQGNSGQPPGGGYTAQSEELDKKGEEVPLGISLDRG